jgi:hypothetical protein
MHDISGWRTTNTPLRPIWNGFHIICTTIDVVFTRAIILATTVEKAMTLVTTVATVLHEQK